MYHSEASKPFASEFVAWRSLSLWLTLLTSHTFCQSGGLVWQRACPSAAASLESYSTSAQVSAASRPRNLRLGQVSVHLAAAARGLHFAGHSGSKQS